MEWKDLPHGAEIFSYALVSLNRFLYNLVPTTAALPWVVTPGKTWTRGNGPLSRYSSVLEAAVRAVSDDFGRHVENDFSLKLQPRNIFHADVFDDKLENMLWKVPIPKRVLMAMCVGDSMRRNGLCRSSFLPSIWTVGPPDGITSVGLLWDEDIKQCVSGAKSDIWSYVLRKANDAIQWAENQGFTWKNINGRWREVIEILTPSLYLVCASIEGARRLDCCLLAM